VGPIPTDPEFEVDGQRPRVDEDVVIDGRLCTVYTYDPPGSRRGFTATAIVFDDAPDLVELKAVADDGTVIGWRLVSRALVKDSVRVGIGQVRAFLSDGSFADTERPTVIDR
jgi:hypothetical protein